MEEQKQSVKTIPLTLRVRKDFLDKFVEVTAKAGYKRTEAIREAMRRFVEELESRK